MKVKHLIAIYLFGLLLMVIGSLLKFLHWPYSSELLIASTAIKTIALLIAIYKVITTDKFKDFLNM